MGDGSIGKREHLRAPLAWFTAWLSLGWAMIVAVILLSLLSISIPGAFTYQDKAFHLVAYFLLMGWFVQLYRRPGHLRWLVLLVALGVVLEFAQGFTRERMFEYADMVANSIGVCMAWLAGGTRAANLLAWFEQRILGLGSGTDG